MKEKLENIVGGGTITHCLNLRETSVSFSCMYVWGTSIYDFPPTFYPLRSSSSQPSSSHAFPVLVRQLDCSYQRTQWNTSLLSAPVIPVIYRDKSTSSFAVLASTAPSFSLHSSSIPSCLEVPGFMPLCLKCCSLPALARAPWVSSLCSGM